MLEKPGTCSSVPNGFELAEVGRCVHDNNCSWTEKCCKNGKAKTCQQPAYEFNSTYPPVPVKIRVKKIASSLLVSWQFPINPSWKNATMFVVEKRHSSKHLRPSNSDYSFWNFAAETTSMKIILKNLVFGYWYQLRVIAYSLNGTNGYSKHSRAIRMNFEIRRPSRPRNFTALGAWFEDSKISVKISWLPPLVLDRPVRKYRIIYFKHVDGTDEHYLTIPVKTKKIPGKETSAILTELESNAIYVVKIQAMLLVKRGKRIKGRWKIMYLKTPPVNQMLFQVSEDPITINSSVVPATTTTTAANFNVKLDFVRAFLAIDGAVSAVIRWKVPDIVVGIQFDYFPEKCRKKVKTRDRKTVLLTAGKNEVTLHELYEDCYYTLRMKTYFPNNSEAPFQKTINFSTYPEAKTTTSTIFSEELGASKSSRLEHSHLLFIFSFLILTINLAVAVS